MRISLVIPAYNEEAYIGGCIESVLKYAPGRFEEIIVVDNASTDRTAAVASAFPLVRVVHEERKGTGFARDCGWRETSGDLVAYIDADVHMREGWVDKVTQAFARNPKLVCITGPYWFYDLPKLEATLLWLNWHFALLGHWLTSGMGVTGNMVLKRDTLEKMGGFDTKFTFAGDDVDTALRASKFGRVRFTFSIILDSSGRRYRKLGSVRTILFYLRNALARIISNKPLEESAVEVR